MSESTGAGIKQEKLMRSTSLRSCPETSAVIKAPSNQKKRSRSQTRRHEAVRRTTRMRLTAEEVDKLNDYDDLAVRLDATEKKLKFYQKGATLHSQEVMDMAWELQEKLQSLIARCLDCPNCSAEERLPGS